MNDLIIYLLKVSGGLGIIFLPYYLLFRNDTNLVIKRFYLLTGLISAWIFPFISFRRPELFVNLTPTVFIDPNGANSLPISIAGSANGVGITINWVQVLIIIYLTGLAFMLVKNLFILFKWNLTWLKTKNDDGVAFTENDQIFTIFSRIFIPRKLKDKQDLNNVLLHEKAHISQLHFIDLLLMEFTLLVTWFNPFSWLISRMIKENHEHLADRQVLSAGVNPARYRAQLLNHTLGVNVFRLGNQFNHSLTIKRFNMMKKPRKSRMGIIKIALLIPAILITLSLTICMTPQQKPIKGKVVFADTGKPARGASVVIRNTTTGTVVDAEGLFKLNVDGDPEIVISFVGYSTLRMKSSKVTRKPLKLELGVFTLDPGVPVSVTKETENTVSIRATDGSGKNPVFVLNGKVVAGIENIDPETIEHIEVIKDPNSELVKKHNATDGIILITLKDGAKSIKEEKQEEVEVNGEIFFVVEEMPMFPGGKAALKTYIYSNLEYPESARKKSISGEVLVQFLVTTSGKLEDIEVVRSSYEGFDKPAMNIFKNMPDWDPGKQRGKPVKVKVVVPVRFNAGVE